MWKNPDHRLFMSNMSKNLWLDLKYKLPQQERALKQMADPLLNFGKGKGTGSYYRGVYMRSPWEISFAKTLDTYRIKWQYEPKRIMCKSGKIYIPDFLLTDYNMLVEIKPDQFVQDHMDNVDFDGNLVYLQPKNYEDFAIGLIHTEINYDYN